MTTFDCGNHKTCTSEINFASICKEYINCDEYIPCQLEKCQEVIYTYDVMCESFSCTTSDGGDSHVLKTFLILFFLTLFAITIFCCYKCRKRIRQQGQWNYTHGLKYFDYLQIFFLLGNRGTAEYSVQFRRHRHRNLSDSLEMSPILINEVQNSGVRYWISS